MTDPERAQVDRINEISAIARTSWLALLGYLAFIVISLLAVEDADFFVESRRTDLPLVGVAIPTYAFFLFAPVLAAALYVYLQVHLLKLWDAIADAPSHIDSHPLGEHLHPWIANDYALHLKGAGALRPRPMRWLGNLATRLLVWIAGPAVIAGFWWRSMPAHDEWLTLAIAGAHFLSLYAGITSWRIIQGKILSQKFAPDVTINCFLGIIGLMLAATVVAVSWVRTEGGINHYITPKKDAWTEAELSQSRLAASWLAKTRLDRVELVELPDTWRTPETARAAFRKTWCEREGLTMTVCDHVPSLDRPQPPMRQAARETWCDQYQRTNRSACLDWLSRLDSRFEASWTEERATTLANLPRLSLVRRDLRNAFASEAVLVDADLAEARLEGAILWRAQMEGANLTRARLDGAHLLEARLKGADLVLLRHKSG